MRYLLLACALLLTGAVTVASAEAPKHTVFLDHVALEALQKSNPTYYAQARKIMASASTLCAPNAGQLWEAMKVEAGQCSSMFLKTSYPPKRQISFQLGDTMYVAHVIVRDAPALLVPVPDRVVPVTPSK